MSATEESSSSAAEPSVSEESEVSEAPEVKSKRPPLPTPDNRSHGPQGRGQGKVNGSQRGGAGGKQFAFRKH